VGGTLNFLQERFVIPLVSYTSNTVTVYIYNNGQIVDQFTVTPAERLLRKIKLSAAQMGPADMAELHIAVDRTFFPAQVAGANSKDPRELGVRVFHAFVDPR